MPQQPTALRLGFVISQTVAGRQFCLYVGDTTVSEAIEEPVMF